MPNIQVAFKNQPVLNLSISESEIGHRYVNLVKENYNTQSLVFRDSSKYSIDYMHQLAEHARQELNWDWLHNNYTLDITTQLHTNLVELLSNNGFDTVPDHLDWLIHELHYCLHTIENGSTSRTAWLQIEWFNQSKFALDYDFEFQTRIEFGAVKFQNPYVGHPPFQVFKENDFKNVNSTCKFHDHVIPGIMIYIRKQPNIIDRAKVLSAFQQHAPEFVELHGLDKIAHYTGAPIIGHVTNLDDLYFVQQSPLLTLDYITFND